MLQPRRRPTASGWVPVVICAVGNGQMNADLCLQGGHHAIDSESFVDAWQRPGRTPTTASQTSTNPSSGQTNLNCATSPWGAYVSRRRQCIRSTRRIMSIHNDSRSAGVLAVFIGLPLLSCFRPPGHTTKSLCLSRSIGNGVCGPLCAGDMTPAVYDCSG